MGGIICIKKQEKEEKIIINHKNLIIEIKKEKILDENAFKIYRATIKEV